MKQFNDWTEEDRKRLRQYRRAIKQTQIDLAKTFNVSSSTISLWESGERKPHRLQRPIIRKLIANY